MLPHDPKLEFATSIVRKLVDAGHQALFAGGCVRDLVLGKTPQDYDVATSAHPEQVRDLFGHRRTLAVGQSFGVIIVLGPKESGQVEVATFRSEGPYLDGRRPESVSFTTAEEDAQRRDFTINGMFFNPLSEEIIDYVGGKADLGQHVIRAIGDPVARMEEDKLRMLRAVRFAAVLAFRIEEATFAAVRNLSPDIRLVSAERIAQELRKILAHPHRRLGVELLGDCRLLPEIFPELSAVSPEHWELALRSLELLDRDRFEPAMALLCRDLPLPPAAGSGHGPESSVHAICRRLRLANHETDEIAWLITHAPLIVRAQALNLAEVKILLANYSAHDLIAVATAILKATGSPLDGPEYAKRLLETHPQEWFDPPHLITGTDLIAAGLIPGPEFKQILGTIRQAQLNEQLTDRSAALAQMQSFIEQSKTHRRSS